MAANPNSNIHNDTWMTDAYSRRGPLGNSPVATRLLVCRRRSAARSPSTPPGRIVTRLPVDRSPPQARIIDPQHARADRHATTCRRAPNPPGTNAVPELRRRRLLLPRPARTGSGSPTKTDHIFVIDEGADGDTLTVKRDYDLTAVLDEPTERITSALPDFDGRIWFVSKQNGKVGTLDREDRRHQDDPARRRRGDRELVLGRRATASTSSPTSACTGFKANENGKPKIVWQAKLPELGDRQAEPGRRRLGDDPDDHGRRLRRDHRQRRPDERGRLPDRAEAAARPEARGLQGARCSSRAPARPRTR